MRGPEGSRGSLEARRAVDRPPRRDRSRGQPRSRARPSGVPDRRPRPGGDRDLPAARSRFPEDQPRPRRGPRGPARHRSLERASLSRGRREGSGASRRGRDRTLGRSLSRCPPGDPRFYTTSIAMTDLDDVRAALGYERVNLYGLSYGTRAALTYLRLFPERVRAADPRRSRAADGSAGPGRRRGRSARDRSRDGPLFVRSRCLAAFPDLAQDLDSVMDRLRPPVEVTLRHPRTGEMETCPSRARWRPTPSAF